MRKKLIAITQRNYDWLLTMKHGLMSFDDVISYLRKRMEKSYYPLEEMEKDLKKARKR